MNIAHFQKPSRYAGSEVNIIRKGQEARVKAALCFPDTYEIGMSHLGLKVLYSIINNIPYASAERVFAPWIDYEKYLRQKGELLSSLESRRPLKDFDIVGFSLQYELSYTNVLNMLDLGGIPVRAEARGDEYPLIIAGGPCAANPMPLAPFIDAFVIGDGEEAVKEIIDVYERVRGQRQRKEFRIQNSEFRSKDELLKALSELEGVYVPAVHKPDRRRIKRRIVENLDEAHFPEATVVPFNSIVHDRIAIEVARGCAEGCRFCQAGIIYRPVRERSPEKILSLAHKLIANTGYEEVSFTSLSTGDYSCLLPLIKTFNRVFLNQRIAISLPSLRVGSVSRDVLDEIKSVRKTGFTIAPEAGTKRLRNVINKNLEDTDYDAALERLFSAGWKNIKLYFMIGLPTETEHDIEGIMNMVRHASRKGRELTKRSVNINVGISAFVPKPHTPFQWLGQMPFKELRKRQDYLRNTLQRGGFNFKGQHVEVSLLEAALSRGDSDMALLVETAWKLGCTFDGWSETFDFQKWLKAAEMTGIDIMSRAEREYELDDKLPWDIIDTDVTKEFLMNEFQNAFKEHTTENCRQVCHNCGLGCGEKIQGLGVRSQESEYNVRQSDIMPSCRTDTHHALPIRIRMVFSKTGALRYLSHLEVVRALLRAMKRAGVPLTYTNGFHPLPKVSFGPALSVGIEGLNEYFDAEVYAPVNTGEIISKVNAVLPEGLRIVRALALGVRVKINDDFIFKYEYEIISDKTLLNRDLLLNFMQSSQHLITREGRTIDIRQMVEGADMGDGILRLAMKDAGGTKVRLYEILEAVFRLSKDELYGLEIKRTGIHAERQKQSDKPSMTEREMEKAWLMI
ncbi:MAG: TIGR03960 family B12-binding radical SAM protein [Nitrospirae bacterium]|nr:TIGR03960 family B12-binding radical SAM protein [Nitrospirota bacterium]